MPDLSSNKTSAKVVVTTKKSSSRPTDKVVHTTSSRHPDSKYSSLKSSRSPPRRRPRLSRSTSSSSSDSDSSDSDSNASSTSTSSRSSKSPPRKSSRLAVTEEKKREHPRPSGGTKTGDSANQLQTKLTDSGDTKLTRDPKKTSSSIISGPKNSEFNRLESNPKSNVPNYEKISDNSVSVGKLAVSTLQDSEPKTSTNNENSKTTVREKVSHLSSRPGKVDSAEKSAQPSDTTGEINKSTRILIEKLTKNITKAHIFEIFSLWGDVQSVDLLPDRIHPEFNRGYGYIEYTDPKAANDAINYMNGGQIDGQEVKVSEVQARPAHSSERPSSKTDDSKRDISKHGRDRSCNRDQYPPGSRKHADSPERSSHRSRRQDDSEKGRDVRARSRSRERLDRNRERERQRDINRTRDRDRDHPRGGRSEGFDRSRWIRRGSSGSPFANRSSDRPRSPLPGSRYRRPSPPGARTGARRPRSRSPAVKSQSSNPRGGHGAKIVSSAHRDRKGSSRSSSSSSSSSSNSSTSSSSGSGSSSSSSSSSSRSHS